MLKDTTLSQQRDMLQRLRDEMEQAKALYEGAKDAYLRELKRYADPSAPPLEQAMRLYEFTRESYKGALVRFNGLVIRGEMIPTQI